MRVTNQLLPPGAIPVGQGFLLNGRYWASQQAYQASQPATDPRQQLLQRSQPSLPEKAIGGLFGLASRAASATGLDDVYETAAAPSRYLGSTIRSAGLGAPGRVLASAAEFATDPLTLAGLALALPTGGTSLAAATAGAGARRLAARAAVNVIGRGPLSSSRYLATSAAAGAGSQIVEEAGGGGLAQFGGGLLGGATALRNAPSSWQRQVGRTVAAAEERAATHLDRFSPEAAQKLRESAATRHSKANVITDTDVAASINNHMSRILWAQGADPAKLTSKQIFDRDAALKPEYMENVKSLRALEQVMGQLQITAIPAGTDMYDVGRIASRHLEGNAAAADWGSRLGQAQAQLDEMEGAALPGLRFSTQGQPVTIRNFLAQEARDILPDLAPVQQALKIARDEGTTLKTGLADAASQLKIAKDAERETLRGLLAQVPVEARARATAKDYISALIGGNPERVTYFQQRLARRFPGYTNLDFDTAVQAHTATGEAQSLATDLAAQAKSTDETLSAIRGSKIVEKQFGPVLKRLSSYMLKPEDGKAFYRVGGKLVEKDGQYLVALEKVPTGTDARRVIEEGARVAAEQSGETSRLTEAWRAAQARAASSPSGSPERMAARSEAQGLRAQLDDLKLARAVPAEQLPPAPNRLLIPLDEATTRFQLYKPAGGSKTIAGEAIKGPTAHLLGQHSTLTREIEDINKRLSEVSESLVTAAESAGMASLPMTPELMVQLSPETAQRVMFLNSELATKQTLLDGVDEKLLGSQQGLEASIADLQDQVGMAQGNYDDALREITEAEASLVQALNINDPESMMAQSVANMRSVNDMLRGELTQTVSARPMTQGTFNRAMEDIQLWQPSIRSAIQKDSAEFLKGHDNLLQRITRDIVRIGPRRAIQSILVPYQQLETNLDPFAVREGLGGKLNRLILANGQKSMAGEGLTTAHLNGRSTASLMANTSYGALYHDAGRVAKLELARIAGGVDPTPARLAWTSADQTVKQYEIGTHLVQIDERSPGVWHVSTERAGAAQGTAADPMGLSAYTQRNAGGSVADLRKVGQFLDQLATDNPNVRILADPSDARRGAAYQRMGFDPAAGRADGMLELNREKLHQLAPSTPEAAWARALGKSGDNAALSAFVKQTVKPATDKEWASLTKGLDLSEGELANLQTLVADNFAAAALFPKLFNIHRLPNSLKRVVEEWGHSYKGLQDLVTSRTGGTGPSVANNLIKPAFRDKFGARGRMPSLDGAAETTLKADQRNLITDLAEVQRRLELDPSAPSLSSILLPAEDMVETLPAQLLLRFNDNQTYRSAGRYLKNSEDWKLLAQGRDLPDTAWKDANVAEDWRALSSIIKQEHNAGPWKAANMVANGASRVAASTLAGDLSFWTIQFPVMAFTNPVQGVKTAWNIIKHGLSDEGMATYLNDPAKYDLMVRATQRGLGLGIESLTGAEKPGTIWDLMPATKGIGKGLGAFNKFTFERAMTILKLEGLEANLSTAQLIQKAGRGAGQQWLDDLPGMEEARKLGNFWNATTDELMDAAIRTTNNAYGGLPRSQRANQAWRDWTERTFLMVPGFFRARAGLINQAARVLGDPRAMTTQGVEGYLAASIMAREIGMATMIAGAAATMLGREDEFLDNLKDGPQAGGRWLSIPMGEGSYLPVLPTSGAYSLYARLATGDTGEGPSADPLARVDAVKRFFEGRQSMAVGGITEQLSGRDFMGRKLDTPETRIASAMANVMPLWLGETGKETVESLRRGDVDPESLLVQTGAEFLGRNYRPPVPAEQLDNAFRQWQAENMPEQPPVAWSDAPGDLRRAALEASPDVAKAENAFSVDLSRKSSDVEAQRNTIWKLYQEEQDGYSERQARATVAVQNGEMDLAKWRQNYSAVNEDRADASERLQKTLAEFGVSLEAGEEKRREALAGGDVTNEVALALLEYRAVRPKQFPRPGATADGAAQDEDIDWGAYGRAREAALEGYSPAVQEQVRQLLEPDDPIARQLLTARAAMDDYWTEVPKYKGLSAPESRFVDSTLASFRQIEDYVRGQGTTADYRQIWQYAFQYMQQQGRITSPRQLELAQYAFQYGTAPAKQKIQMRTVESMEWLLANPDVIRFYPWMARELPSLVQKLLPSDLQPQVDLGRVEEAQLRGVNPEDL